MNKFKKWHVILVLIIILIITFVTVAIVCINPNKKEIEKPIETIKPEEVFSIEEYNYYLNENTTEYMKKIFNDLYNELNKEEINKEEYASLLTKIFISDLFTLNIKNGSSDITSTQYVYTSYQETYEKIVKNTLYTNIEINIDGTRTQELPIVKNVDIVSIENKPFYLNNQIIDQNAFYIKTNIEYEKDLGYPTNYEIVLVENNNFLQVAAANEF